MASLRESRARRIRKKTLRRKKEEDVRDYLSHARI